MKFVIKVLAIVLIPILLFVFYPNEIRQAIVWLRGEAKQLQEEGASRVTHEVTSSEYIEDIVKRERENNYE